MLMGKNWKIKRDGIFRRRWGNRVRIVSGEWGMSMGRKVNLRLNKISLLF